MEEITRLLHRDCEVHQVAKDSHLGWSLLPFLDEEETAYEERDSSKLIKSKEVVTAEKAYMSYHLDKGKTASFSGTGSGRGAANNRGKGKSMAELILLALLDKQVRNDIFSGESLLPVNLVIFHNVYSFIHNYTRVRV